MSRIAIAVLAAGLSLGIAPAVAVESDPLPPGDSGPRAKAIALYNEGVKVMLEKRFADAQRLFEQALEHDEGIAEAHNNLAFSLRMQSPAHFARSMRHYGRALQLNPRLAQAYMYRGVLLTQMGDHAGARADLEKLKALDPQLAEKLERAIADGGRSDQRDGIAAQVDGIY